MSDFGTTIIVLAVFATVIGLPIWLMYKAAKRGAALGKALRKHIGLNE